MDGLNTKQQKFVEGVVAGMSAKDAYTAAGYGATGAAAEVNASRLLRKAKVQAEIDKARASAAERLGITAERVLRELARVGFSDPRRLFRPDGGLKPVAEWDDDAAACVASVETLEEFEGKGEDREFIGHTRKVKLWDKKGSLELLGKHLGLFKEEESAGSGPVWVKVQLIPPRPEAPRVALPESTD